jgi:hypothetical protein
MAVFCSVVWYKLTDVSEVLAASINISLMMEAASTSETSKNSCQTNGAATQKTPIFILAAART